MKSRELTSVALMTAVLVVLGLVPGIPVGIIPVPIVFQNMGVMLAALLLGVKKGTLAVFLLLLLAAVGLPVLTGGSGGLPVFVGPTGGYLFGWLLMPVIANSGLRLLQNTRANWAKFLVIWLACVICSDLLGTIWLTFQSHISFITALISNVAFLPGDTIKALIAFTLAKMLQKQNLSQNVLL